MDIDTTIRDLFDKLNGRKAKVDVLKAAVQKSWKTNGTFRLIGSTSTTNIQTCPVETIDECAVQLCMIDGGVRAASTLLGRTIRPNIQGYSLEDWISDFQKRLATIGIRDEEKQIEALEARLNSVLSPEQRRAIEVELLLKEI